MSLNVKWKRLLVLQRRWRRYERYRCLHAALYMAGVERGDFVITQALTFVATRNALYHMGAEPIFVDVSPVSLGLCP
ncbi:DegT/DnrJ/EryC1/StrS family aminotransferase [Vibrio sp. 03_296]|uniref:DegT/DnrJ/EryC1/StrS family aminotransferase n=1 Tax=Vibrio sp. 03_296 TaxID=2024409 RepID=UPI0034E8607B